MTAFSDIAALAGNALTYAEGRSFAAIIGTAPSKGARSPMLWNAAFKAQGIDAEMLPIDIPSEKLEQLLTVLDANPHFLGGAVAVPHKESVAQWLKERLPLQVKAIGAVNCLFRNEAGRLAGTNTDGEGALLSFESHFGKVEGKSVLLLGPGGAGKAVAVFVRQAIGTNGQLRIAGRSETGRQYAEQLKCDWIKWSEVTAALSTTEVLINCTSVGAAAAAGQTPVSKENLSLLPRHAVVFDVIYDPSPSALLSLAVSCGLQVLDGSEMNLAQAVLAYGYAAAQPKGRDVTCKAMEQAKQMIGRN